MLKMAVAELIKCRDCGHEFNPYETNVCEKCHSHICPNCLRCLCSKVSKIFDDQIFKKEF